MADSRDPTVRLEHRELEASVSWVAKLVNGTIVISLERLAGGHDVQLILSHESCHAILIDSSVFGQQMEILAALGQPPMPTGRLQANARSLLREGMAASIKTQEACATFLPSRRLTGKQLDAYWASVSPTYRQFTESLEWLRSRELPDEAVTAIVFGLGGFALGTRFAGSELANSRAFITALADPRRNPDERFLTACRVLSEVADAELVALAQTKSPAEAISDRWYPTANGEGEAAYEAAPDGAEWIGFWQELVNEIASAWSVDSGLTQAERELLTHVQHDALPLAPTPTYTTLKATVKKTEWHERPILHHPAVDQLLGHRLATIDMNPLEHDLPGIRIEGERELRLKPGEALVEVVSRDLPEAVAVLSSSKLSEYVRRADDDTTICCIDAWYVFEAGDLMAEEPLVRHRPHVVLLERQSLGGVLRRLEVAGVIADDPAAKYTVLRSDISGLSYFVLRPGSAPYPLIIAPVPGPTADRAVELLEGEEYGKLGWQYQLPPDFLMSARSMVLALGRVCATFEGAKWPKELGPSPESADLLPGHEEDEQLTLYNGIIDRFDSEPEPSRREVVGTALLDKGGRLDALERYDEALAAYDEVARRFGDEPDLTLRRLVAEALAKTVGTLGRLERYPDALAVCDTLVARFGEASDAELRSQVALTLVNKGVALGRMERYDETIKVYDEVVARFGPSAEPELRDKVADALVGKGWALGRLERHTEALAIFDEISERYAEDGESEIQEQVAEALTETAITLGRLKRYEQALDVFDQVERRFANSAKPWTRRRASIAMVKKAIMLTTLERYDEALEIYDDIAARFYDPSNLELSSSVASAFFNRGLILGTLGRHEEEIESYNEVSARFGSVSDPEMSELVTMAEANKASRIVQLITGGHQERGPRSSWRRRRRGR